MGRWGDGTFACDSALDWLANVADGLIAELDAMAARWHQDPLSWIPDEGMIPRVVVLLDLIGHGTSPPSLAKVEGWRRSFMGGFDLVYPDYTSPEFLEKHRASIEAEFSKLIELCQHHEEKFQAMRAAFEGKPPPAHSDLQSGARSSNDN